MGLVVCGIGGLWDWWFVGLVDCGLGGLCQVGKSSNVSFTRLDEKYRAGGLIIHGKGRNMGAVELTRTMSGPLPAFRQT
jgi:hypothetical protein